MKHELRSYLFAAAGFVVMNTVVAGPSCANTLVGPTDNASGINGLVIDGVTYDAAFFNSSYNSVYTTSPTFLGNETGALDAVAALISAFHDLGVTKLVGMTTPGGFSVLYAAVPYLEPTPALNWIVAAGCPTDGAGICPAPNWGNGGGLNLDPATTYPQLDYAVFTEETRGVPGPIAGAGLPGLILGGGSLLGWWRRKRKGDAAIAAA